MTPPGSSGHEETAWGEGRSHGRVARAWGHCVVHLSRSALLVDAFAPGWVVMRALGTRHGESQGPSPTESTTRIVSGALLRSTRQDCLEEEVFDRPRRRGNGQAA